MKAHTPIRTLAALAFGFALPVSAAAPAPLISLGQLMNEQGESGSPAELAQQYPALALLPANATEFATLNQVHRLLPLLHPGATRHAASFESAALATTPRNIRLLNATAEFAYNVAQLYFISHDDEPLRAQTEDAAAAISTQHLDPLYLTLTCRPGEEQSLMRLADALSNTAGLDHSAALPEGCSGGRITDDYPKGSLKQLAALFQPLWLVTPDRPLYLLTRVQGRALVVALCEDTADFRLAASPAQSALTGATLARSKDGAEPLAALQLTPAPAGSRRNIIDIATTAYLGTVAKEWPAFREGARHLTAFCRQLADYPATHPTTAQLWQEQDGMRTAWHLTFRTDARGLHYEQGELRQLDVAADPHTLAYAETTPLHTGGPVSTRELLRSLLEWGLADATVFGAPEEGSDKPTHRPLFDRAPAGPDQMLRALTGDLALVMDGGNGSETPQVQACAGLQDRALLTEGYDSFMSEMERAGESRPPRVTQSRPKVHTSHEGNTTCHTTTRAGMQGNALLTNRHLCFGISTALGQRLLSNAAEPGLPAAGSVFYLRPAASRYLSDMQQISTTIDTILGTATITDGCFTLQLRANLRPFSTK